MSSISMSLTIFVGLGGRRPEFFDFWPALTTSQEVPSTGVGFAEIAMVYWEDGEGDRIGCAQLCSAVLRQVGQPLSPSDTEASLAAFPCGCLLTFFLVSFGASYTGFLGLVLLVKLSKGLFGSLFNFPVILTRARCLLGRRYGAESRSAKDRLHSEA